jgi:hypothetical protein
VGVIDAILEEDKTKPTKQQHTAKRIFDRLRAEHAFPGGYTIVKDYVRAATLRRREMFVPLTHAPGTAQADFGEALGPPNSRGTSLLLAQASTASSEAQPPRFSEHREPQITRIIWFIFLWRCFCCDRKRDLAVPEVWRLKHTTRRRLEARADKGARKR